MFARLLSCGVICAAILLGGPARAQMAADTSITAPPVAPPLKKGSPLDHLTNDPKLPQPTIGYREGRTQGEFWVAHRSLDDMGGMGWGWVRKNDDGWSDAKWVALQEQPGLAVAPFRRLGSLTPTGWVVKRDADADWEYKFWGTYATYKAYDPHLDERIPVFILQGYEVIGPAKPLRRYPGPPDRPHSKGSGASSRSTSPIQSNRDID